MSKGFIKKEDFRAEILELIDDYKEWEIPAAPREMTAREFVKARRRLCEAHLNAITQSVDDFVTRCEGCVLENYCEGSKDNVDGEVAIVEKWAREHPEERSEE